MIEAPALTFAFEARVSVSPPIEQGPSPAGGRRVIPIAGGVIEGPMLNGTVVPGGADWQLVHGDGTIDLTARYTIEATDGTLIGVVNCGYRHAAPDVLARLARREAVDPSLVYFRTTPRFTAPPEGPHAWLNRTIMVCTARRHPDGVQLFFFKVE